MADEKASDEEIFGDIFDEEAGSSVPPELVDEPAKEPEEVKAEEPAAEGEEKEPEPEVKAEEPADEEPPPPEPQAEDNKSAHKVPLPELLDERKQRQAAQTELAELKGQFSGLQGQLTQLQQLMVKQPGGEAEEEIDFLTEPDKAVQKIQGQFDQQLTNTRLNLSEAFAKRQFGAEVVDAAFQAAQNQGVAGQFVNHADPYGALVEWNKQQQVVTETGGDLEAFKENMAKELREQILAELKGESNPSSQAKTDIPPSIADATSAADNQGEAVPGDAQLFSETFKD